MFLAAKTINWSGCGHLLSHFLSCSDLSLSKRNLLNYVLLFCYCQILRRDRVGICVTAYCADQSRLLLHLFACTRTVLCSEIKLFCIVSSTIRCSSMTAARIDISNMFTMTSTYYLTDTLFCGRLNIKNPLVGK